MDIDPVESSILVQAPFKSTDRRIKAAMPHSSRIEAPALPAANQHLIDLRQRRGRRLLYGLGGSLVMACSWSWWVFQALNLPYRGSNLLQPPEMALAQFAPRDAIGNLGGVPVKIPQHYSGYLEYEGDPGFGPQRSGPPPPRTINSKIESFGFDVPFPTMEALSAIETSNDKDQRPKGANPWIMVGVHSGNIYRGAAGLANLYKFTVLTPEHSTNVYYSRMTDKPNNLQVFELRGTDPNTHKPFREGQYAKDIFIHRSASGEIDTYITCQNQPATGGFCEHTFTMGADMLADVNLQYHREMLTNWQNIQESVSKKIRTFSIK